MLRRAKSLQKSLIYEVSNLAGASETDYAVAVRRPEDPRVGMNAAFVPDVRHQPDFEEPQPVTGPRENRSAKSPIWSPKAASGYV